MANIIKINKTQPPITQSLDSTVMPTFIKLLKSNVWTSGFTPTYKELRCYHSQPYKKKKVLLGSVREFRSQGELLS